MKRHTELRAGEEIIKDTLEILLELQSLNDDKEKEDYLRSITEKRGLEGKKLHLLVNHLNGFNYMSRYL